MTARPVEPLNIWLCDELPALAPAWLPAQRWFGGKSRLIARVDVEEVFWISVEPRRCGLVVIDVAYDAATAESVVSERYVLVVGIYDEARGGSLIGRIEGRHGLYAVEAGTDGPAARALLRGFVSGAPLPGARGGVLTYADATQAVKLLLASSGDASPAAVPVGLEQSNTSLRLGTSHVFKLFRRLEEGENPQLEIGRFLATRTTFRSVPPLEGSLTYRAPDGRVATLGLLEGWIPNRGDGWSYVVAQLERAVGDGSGLDALAQDMFVLGTTTADLHAALASDPTEPAFAPAGATPAAVHGWRAALLSQADRAMALIERYHTRWPDQTARLGRALLENGLDVAGRFPGEDLGPGHGFHMIRVHGDYHLGQTLKTAEGFALIDFEGEPATPLAERRRKHCALKDVAGMMRSFEYATQTVAERLGAAGSGLSASGLREAFVEGYRTRAMAGGATFLPSSPDALASWIGFFELEKALYEIEYEVNNRPAWVDIPLRGVTRILQDGV